MTAVPEREALFDDSSTAADLEAIARQHDRERAEARLDDPAHLTVESTPLGATVSVVRFVERGPLWEERAASGPELTPGAYAADLRLPDRPAVRATFRLAPGERRNLKVRLPEMGAVEEGFVYVPGGAYLVGGDRLAPEAGPRAEITLRGFAIATHLVTMEEYAAFLNALDDEEAARRAPRIGNTPYWTPANGRYEVPFTDPDGDEIGADWPVCMLSASDADAYARWRSAQTGRLVRLPTSDEWEVAAGGGDGRVFPWGDGFDPSLCRMLTSAPRAGPCPVGSYPRDRSPFGVLDTAGLVREHTSTEIDGQRVVRGGAWPAAPVQCRIGRRSLLGPDETYVTFGFRLAHDV